MQRSPRYARVILFSMPGCHFCDSARQDLMERGISFEEVVLEGGSELFAHLAGILGEGDVEVPIVLTIGFDGSCSFGPQAYCRLPGREPR